jgi:hypothetical protein
LDNLASLSGYFEFQYWDFKWIDDFAAARNYAQSLATCDYIFRFDADCILKDGDMEKLLKIKNNNFENSDLLNLNYVEQFESDESNVNPLFQESICFFYRRNKFRWELAIHEKLTSNIPNFAPKVTSYDNLIVFHHRSESGKTWRTKQNLDILKVSLNKKDSNYDRMLYFYARELYFDHQYDKSIVQYQKLLTQTITTTVRDYAIEKFFFALFYSKQNHKIPEFLRLIENNKNPRIVLLKADVLCLSDPVAAAEYYNNYLQKPFLQNDCDTEYDIERFQIHPYIQLAKIQIHQGDLQNAKINLNEALTAAKSPATIIRIKKLLEFC